MTSVTLTIRPLDADTGGPGFIVEDGETGRRGVGLTVEPAVIEWIEDVIVLAGTRNLYAATEAETAAARRIVSGGME